MSSYIPNNLPYPQIFSGLSIFRLPVTGFCRSLSELGACGIKVLNAF